MSNARTRRFTFLHALIACYVVAMFWPAPGQWLLSVRPLPEDPFGQHQFLRIVLAVAVFLASLAVGRQLRGRLSRHCVGLAAVAAVSKIVLGLGMLGLIALAMPLAAGSSALTGLMAGLAVVVAMPTAVSAIAWTSRTRSDETVALLTTITTTIGTPITVGLLLALIPLTGRGSIDAVDYQYTLNVLFCCLIVPGAAGICVGRLAIAEGANLAFVGPVNSCLILALNYCNASLLFPSIFPSQSVLPAIVASMLALAVLVILMSAGKLIGSALRATPRQAAAMRYSISMYNTGLAIVIVAEASHANPWIVLTPAVFTILQHIAAAGIERAAAVPCERPRESPAICVGSSRPIRYRAECPRIRQ